jgi:cell division protein ZapA
MAHVTVSINGKHYRMACDDGQEAHLTTLAERLDETIEELKGAFGEVGDTRLAVMAGIVMTDKLSEVERRLKGLEVEVEALREGRAGLVSRLETGENRTARSLAGLADRLEAVAGILASDKMAASRP